MSKSIILSVLAATAPLAVQANPNIDSFIRIVGGNDAELGDYPYYAQLGGCGGTLIAPDVILTAAHCPNPPWVVVGNNQRSSLAEGGHYIPEGCMTFERDDTYEDRNQFDNDFALCRLREPVEIDTSEVRLELNLDPGEPEPGDILRAIGMGTLSYGGAVTTTLQWVDVPYITNSKCQEYYGNGRDEDNNIVPWILDSMICAGFENGEKDSCQGDSGGPLVLPKENPDGTQVHMHVGVVSWGNGCAKAGYPGVYARNSKRAQWIKDKVCIEYGSDASFCQQNDSPPEPEDPPQEDPPQEEDPPEEEDEEEKAESEPPTGAPTVEADDETEAPTTFPSSSPTESPSDSPTLAPTEEDGEEQCEDNDVKKMCSRLKKKFVDKNRWNKLIKKCKKPLYKKNPEKGLVSDYCQITCALVDLGPCA